MKIAFIIIKYIWQRRGEKEGRGGEEEKKRKKKKSSLVLEIKRALRPISI